MKRCLIYLGQGKLNAAIDMLDVIQKMYPEEQVEIMGLAINRSYDEAEGVFDKIIVVEDQEIQLHDQRSVCQVVKQLEDQWKFDAVLVPATPFGRMLAPRVAMALHVGLVADVTAIKRKGEVLEMIRPAFSGRLLAGITSKGKRPYMMSIRQGVFTYSGTKEKDTQIITFQPKDVVVKGLKVISKKEKPTSYDIRESDVLISGGGGVIKDFHMLEDLAENLGGQVSASRRIVDKGIAPRSIQVGQSGKTVSPKLYMALGIYGSIQHVEGLKNVESIISVNTNKNAPICSLSDIVVEGDASVFIEKLTNKIKEKKTDI